ncbi:MULTISPECIES: TOMM precursor leader peptide-binding protein [Nostoc]|uniref:TOMM leader peptide-binding protein n=1 Tax=Nostoc paludosum FACHB-159 TaxID=2692908 RepID=A0ABR8K386_9NOSO|nr:MULTISPECIES: TOMM precursor leader peptide-binding protein [Nostoc]MBD2677102.1 TOMM precursor leader peptide-binding protein [Nostoc sp. FACHB-857]MBD2733301.1 TOMM precursor leader peptide-binding protein [Nostoc paludosum FACHB-159]
MQSTTLLQIKPHFHIEVIEPKQVYLLGEQGNHALTGELYCQIVPLLDGQHTIEQIIQKLDGQVPAEYIDYVLNRLAEKGYLTEATPDLSPEVAAFWTELGIAPPVAAQGLKQPVTLTTVGDNISEVTVAALATALRDMGIPVQNSADAGSRAALNIVLTDDYLQSGLAAINKQALERQQTWVLVKPVGSVLWLGPVFVPGKTGCWSCLAHRLRGNREVEASVLQQKQLQQERNGQKGRVESCLPTARATLPSTLQTGLQFAATEIAKWIVKQHVNATAPGTALFPTLDGKVITFNQTILDLKSHILTKRPQCPACGDQEIMQRQGFEPLKLESRPKQFTHDGGYRTTSPEQTLQKYQHLISPVTGVVTELVRVSDPNNPLVHTYRAVHSFGSATTLRGLRNTLNYKSSGKGKTDSQSKASGFGEAVERYSGIFQGDEPRKRATLAELGDLAIHPEQCLYFSDDQYANREALNAQGSAAAYRWIPHRFDASKAIDWTPVWSLTEQKHKYVPTGFCYYNYPMPEAERFCKADSNGNAAGNTLEEAILQGFMELVERDCVALWWYNRLSRPGVDLASFDEPYFVQLQQFYREQNRELWVLDLTADLGIPAFAGISYRTVGSSERIGVGFGAHLDPKIAIVRTLTELSQIGLQLDKIPDEQLKGESKDWLLGVTRESHPCLIPDALQPLKTASDYPNFWSDDIYTDVMKCVEIAQTVGLETLVLDQTRPDIGLNVVKVIVPGMRTFWSRLGPGRLYDVPVKLGWLKEPLRETQMNPTNIPF